MQRRFPRPGPDPSVREIQSVMPEARSPVPGSGQDDMQAPPRAHTCHHTAGQTRPASQASLQRSHSAPRLHSERRSKEPKENTCLEGRVLRRRELHRGSADCGHCSEPESSSAGHSERREDGTSKDTGRRWPETHARHRRAGCPDAGELLIKASG